MKDLAHDQESAYFALKILRGQLHVGSIPTAGTILFNYFRRVFLISDTLNAPRSPVMPEMMPFR
jgi:hypothetical protein